MTYRNGSRPRPWITRVGGVTLRIPTLRQASFFPNLDEVVDRFRTRALEGPYPYLWVDAKYIKSRDDGRVISMALVIAVGVKATGEREVLGFDLGPSEAA